MHSSHDGRGSLTDSTPTIHARRQSQSDQPDWIGRGHFLRRRCLRHESGKSGLDTCSILAGQRRVRLNCRKLKHDAQASESARSLHTSLRFVLVCRFKWRCPINATQKTKKPSLSAPASHRVFADSPAASAVPLTHTAQHSGYSCQAASPAQTSVDVKKLTRIKQGKT